ncbi:hypothetical protein HN51_005668, partial [Arachis hypogaea]
MSSPSGFEYDDNSNCEILPPTKKSVTPKEMNVTSKEVVSVSPRTQKKKVAKRYVEHMIEQ